MNPVSHRIDTFLDALHESYTSQLHPPPAHIGGRHRRQKRLKSRRRQHQYQKNRNDTITKPKQKQTKRDNIYVLENKMYNYLSKHKHNHPTQKRMKSL